MIDLHNHIVFGVDDGAADLAESIAIARQFASEGVDRVVATPHFNSLRHSSATDLDVRGRVEKLRQALADEDVGVDVLPGNEIFLMPDVPGLVESGAAISLGDSSAVLVESAFDFRPPYLDDTLFALQVAGYQPVLAHPERYAFVQRDVHSLDGLLDRGIVMQLTAPSLLGEYGGSVERTARRLLLAGAYALAGSDRHHPGPTRSLRDLRERIDELAGEGVGRLLLTDNPGRLLAGQSVESAPAGEPRSATWWEKVLGRG